MKKLSLLILITFGCFTSMVFAKYTSYQKVCLSQDLVKAGYYFSDNYKFMPYPGYDYPNDRQGELINNVYGITVKDDRRKTTGAYLLILTLVKDEKPICYFSSWAKVLPDGRVVMAAYRHAKGQKVPACVDAGFKISPNKTTTFYGPTPTQSATAKFTISKSK